MHNAFCTYYIADIPQGRLKTEIEKLAQHPEYAYLKQLQTAKNTDWHQIRLAYDKWDYKHEGLTGAGAALIALAVAAATAGSGTGAALGLKGTAAASADAAFASLATQASISLINNKGNIGNTLKELGRSSTVKNLVVAAATAGVSDKIGASSALKVSDTQWINKLTVNLANAGSAALIDGAVNGGSLKDKLEAAILSALVDTAHGEVSGKIKQPDRHYIAHKIAHAVAGCAAAAANKGKCRDGAIGAAVGEIIGEALLDGRNPVTLSAQDKAKIAARAKLVAGTVAALNNGDVNAAANAAEVAVRNNSTVARRTVTRWTARQQVEHEYALLQIQSLTNQIRRIEPQFNGIAIMRVQHSPWSQNDVQLYQRYYDNLRSNRGLPAQPIYRLKMANGVEFNNIMSSKYPYNELYVVNRNSPSGYARVDSYNPVTREIVSRKFTQLAQVQSATAISYIREAATKYRPGTPIANVHSTSPILRNQNLQGTVILEVPVQTRPIPQSVLREANSLKVLIRDNKGNIYNGK